MILSTFIIIITFAATIVAFGSEIPTTDEPKNPEPFFIPNTRVIGGVEARPHEFPWIASLHSYDSVFCGATILNDQYLVTAAHCVEKPGFTVKVGKHNVTETELTEQVREHILIFSHPDYNKTTYENDIAVLKVHPPISINEYVYPAVLPWQNRVSEGVGTVAGWGVTESGSRKTSDVLRKVTVPLIDDITCGEMYGHLFKPDKQFCAGLTDVGGKDSCQGDSGGPFLCYQGSDTYLCGIVSFGFECARFDYAGVYVQVSYYAQWIHKTVRESRKWRDEDGNEVTYPDITTPKSKVPVFIPDNGKTPSPEVIVKSHSSINSYKLLTLIFCISWLALHNN